MSESKVLEHECMACGNVYWAVDKPQFCPRCNSSMVRVIWAEDELRAMLADAHEEISALRLVVDAKDQTIEALRGEVERLREALVSISNGPSYFSGCSTDTLITVSRLIETARKALEEK